MDITNRTVFIAGATSGIGLELARRFAAAGSDAIAGGRRTDLLRQHIAGRLQHRPIPAAGAALIAGGRRTDLLGKLVAQGSASVPIDLTDAASIVRARDTILRSH